MAESPIVSDDKQNVGTLGLSKAQAGQKCSGEKLATSHF